MGSFLDSYLSIYTLSLGEESNVRLDAGILEQNNPQIGGLFSTQPQLEIVAHFSG